MLSIYNSGYQRVEDMTVDYNLKEPSWGYYYPPGFIPLIPLTFHEDDEYKTFLIEGGKEKGSYQPQHFAVVIRRRSFISGGHRRSDTIYTPPYEYYSMGFGGGPSRSFILASPDFTLRKRTDIHKYTSNEPEFTPLGSIADSLNQLVLSYQRGGYIKYDTSWGYFGVHSSKKYSVVGNMCLTGFERIFPIPQHKLKNMERLCYFLSTGKTRRKRKN